MLDRFKKIAFSPFFHSLIISVIIFLFLPDAIDRYIITSEADGTAAGTNEIICFDDLDNDGFSEKISSFYCSDSLHAIQVFDKDNGIIGQWSLNKLIPGNAGRMHFSDYDHDGKKEVFAFSVFMDSLLLSCFNPSRNNEFILRERFVTLIKQDIPIGKMEISDILSADFTGDGNEELAFVVNNGSPFIPRQVFIYDLTNDSLWFSHTSGVALKTIGLIDMNNDGIPEITGNHTASANVPENDSIPYSDYSAWLFCFDRNLDFLFPPVEFPGIHSEIMTEPFTFNNNNYLAAFYNHTGSGTNEPCLILVDSSGNIAARALLPETTKTERFFFKWCGSDDKYYVTGNNGAIYRWDENLQFRKLTGLNLKIHSMPIASFDLDDDGENEVIMYIKGNKQMAVFRNEFTHPVVFKVPVPSKIKEPESFQIVLRKDQQPKLFVQIGDSYNMFSYRFNPMFYMRYPLYAAIYLVVTGLVFLLRFAQRMQMREKIKMREDIARLQMKAINQQIDPHFTLNAFNSIASLLKREKGETAYEYFMRFTDLIRISLVTTDEVFRTREEELTVVRNYLDLQKLRFGDRFNYEIIISEDVNPRQLIPKMIIQTYTENAVKHGFRETRSGGLLKVDVVVKDGYLEIAVQDNGMGRKKAGALKKESTGLGLAAMDRYIELLNRNYDLKIEKEIIDLADQNGEPAGTRVVIKIP